VPSAIRLQREYGDDLVVLLVEVQGSKTDAITKLQLGAKWLGTQAMWTSERPFRVPSGGKIPHFALLDPQGRVALMGLNGRLHSQIVEQIESMVQGRKKASKELTPAVAKAEVKMRNGDFGVAYRAANKLLATTPRKDAERVTTEATQLRDLVVTRATGAVDRIEWMAFNGYANQAKDALDDLSQALKGIEDLETRLSQISVQLKSKEMAQELAAARKIAKLEQKLYADPGASFRKSFEKLNQAFAGTKAAERAAYWMQVLPE
jgi:hypothetical protein